MSQVVLPALKLRPNWCEDSPGSPSILPYRVGLCVTHLLGLGNGLGCVAEGFCECNLLPSSVQYAPSDGSVFFFFFFGSFVCPAGNEMNPQGPI